MSEPLEWKEVKQFGLGKIAQEVDKLTKQVVVKEIEGIGSKLKMLQAMGVVNNNEKLNKILSEIEKLRTLK